MTWKVQTKPKWHFLHYFLTAFPQMARSSQSAVECIECGWWERKESENHIFPLIILYMLDTRKYRNMHIYIYICREKSIYIFYGILNR